ncbi:dCTP deaminase [Frankliniella fusca]|uniref:dCTP deaminase n=1 Tax=Frankliniella fusca TaxID=407009 RepID=A0AAE1HCU2_9NEOP|nr:dCTP deaminase [Frankliniella fusca]
MDADQGDIDPNDFDPPSDESHDESDEDIGDADPQFYRLHDRIDEKHHAADMIANCRIKANATRAGVRAAVTDCELLLEARSRNLKSCAREFLAEQNMMNHPQAGVFLGKFDIPSPFKGWKTDRGQVNAIKSY